MGWIHTFRERPWLDVRDFLSKVDWTDHEGDYLFDIIDSVVATSADDLLAVTTSMHDLVIALRPVDEPPLNVIVVCAPGSVRPHPPGTIRIYHSAVVGNNTDIERPVSEGLRLFWRFVDIEFGIKPKT